MSPFLTYLINEITSNITEVQAIILRGSHLNENTVDFWSDLDVLVVLEPLVHINEEVFIRTINKSGQIIGSELYINPESILYRTAIEHNQSIELLDVTICTYNEWLLVEATSNISLVVYGHIELCEPIKEDEVSYSFNSYEHRIGEIWYKYVIAIKKFARRDHLIGLHLLLDLVREYLVLEMIERDIQHNTNIHRHGFNEELPDYIKLSHFDDSNIEVILNYIERLAFEYDKKLQHHVLGYSSQFDRIAKYIEESRQQLK